MKRYRKMSHQSQYKKKRIQLTQSQSNSSVDSTPLTQDSPPLNSRSQSTPIMDTPPPNTTTRQPLPTPDPEPLTGGLDQSIASNGRKGTKKLPAEKVTLPANRLEKLIKKLTEFYATIGLFVSRASIYDGVLIMRESENRARELVAVAQHHKGMLAVLEQLVESNDYITMTVGHGMMVYAILAHHGRVKADVQILSKFGYLEEQVLGTLPELQASPV